MRSGSPRKRAVRVIRFCRETTHESQLRCVWRHGIPYPFTSTRPWASPCQLFRPVLKRMMTRVKCDPDPFEQGGKLLPWSQCLVTPPDATLLVTQALQIAATFLTTTRCSPVTGQASRQMEGRG